MVRASVRAGVRTEQSLFFARNGCKKHQVLTRDVTVF